MARQRARTSHESLIADASHATTHKSWKYGHLRCDMANSRSFLERNTLKVSVNTATSSLRTCPHALRQRFAAKRWMSAPGRDPLRAGTELCGAQVLIGRTLCGGDPQRRCETSGELRSPSFCSPKTPGCAVSPRWRCLWLPLLVPLCLCSAYTSRNLGVRTRIRSLRVCA